MKNIEDETPCPICKNVVMSDADAFKYCKICGMSIKYDSITINRHNRKFYFCSEYCKNLFLKFGFKSFRMHDMQKVN
jgi:YHS domain-containing protein